MKIAIRTAALGAWWLGAVAATLGAAEPQAAACAECHEELAAAFSGSAHGKAFAHDSTYAAASCANVAQIVGLR